MQPKAGIVILIACVLTAAASSFAVSAANTDRAFKRGAYRLVEIWDSGVFFVSARTLIALSSKSTTPLSPDVEKRHQKDLAAMLILDGPVLPALAAKAILLGKPANVVDVNAVAWLMCILQTVTGALVLLVSFCATGSRPTALATGLIWAIYPPAVIATQRLGTETLSTALLLAVLLCFSLVMKSKEKNLDYLIALAYGGVFFALLLLTKPVLMFCVLLPFAFVLASLQKKAALKAVLIFGAATAMALSPFWIFTQQATGSICFIPQRIPLFNALVSNSLISDGLQCVPQTPLPDKLARLKSVAAIEITMFLEDPIAHTDLNLRKLPRIFCEPWNDFRRSVWLVGPAGVRFTHQLLALMGLAALGLALAQAGNSLKSVISRKAGDQIDSSSATATLLLLALFGHLVYAAFEGIPRYGFTAAPLSLILVTWAIWKCRKSLMQKLRIIRLTAPLILLVSLANFAPMPVLLSYLGSPILAGILLATANSALFGWLVLETAAAARHSSVSFDERLIKGASALCFTAFTVPAILSTIYEMRCAELKSQISGPVLATRDIDLSGNAKANAGKAVEWAMILIDASKEISQSHITLNGHKLHETPRNVFFFHQQRYNVFTFQEQIADALNIDLHDVRQWRAVPVPVEYVNLNGRNKITVSPPPAAPLTIYGDYNEVASKMVPTLGYLSQSRIFVSATSLDWRPRWHVLTDAPSESMIESNEPKYQLPPNADLSDAPGMQKGRYRMLLALGFSKTGRQKEFDAESKTFALSSLKFSDVKGPVDVHSEGQNEGTITIKTNSRAEYLLNAQPRSTHLNVELSGKAGTANGDRKQAIVSIRLGGPQVSQATLSEHPHDSLYYDCLGQPKIESISYPNATQMLNLTQKERAPLEIKTIFPLDVVRGKGDHLTVEIMPLADGTELRLEDAELNVREVEWPDLDHGEAFVY